MLTLISQRYQISANGRNGHFERDTPFRWMFECLFLWPKINSRGSLQLASMLGAYKSLSSKKLHINEVISDFFGYETYWLFRI